MTRSQTGREQKRESPIQFRPGAELGHLVDAFANEQRLQPAEACRVFIALAVTEMDCRYYALIRQLAEAIGGESAFTRACVHVHAALEGARRVTNTPLQLDPERSLFIERTVHDYLASRGLQEQASGLWFLPERKQEQLERSPDPTPPSGSARKKNNPNVRKRRNIRPLSESEVRSEDQPAG